MKKLLIILYFLCAVVKAQNFVPNPSFENYDSLPCNFIVPPASNFSDIMQNWILATYGTSDIYSTLVSSSCFANYISTNVDALGKQNPRTGHFYCGLNTYGNGCGVGVGYNYREYIEVQLTQPLIVGQKYYAEMFVSKADYCQYANNNLGMCFSDTLVSKPNLCNNLNLVPQINENLVITDYLNWVKVSGMFIANSPLQYLIIGNFYTNSNTLNIYTSSKPKINGYYYVDDVSVVPVPCLTVSNDTTICIGDTVSLFAISDSIIGWANSLNPNTIISTDSILTVTLQDTTTYFVYSSCDTSSVTVYVNSLLPTFSLVNDTTLCAGEILNLNATSATPYTTYLWQNNSTNATYNVTQQGTYWVSASSYCGVVSDTINVNYNPLPVVNFGNDTTLCEGAILTLNATNSNASFLWQDGSTNNLFNVIQQGTYWVRVTKNKCVSSDTINVDYDPLPIVNLGNDTTLCNGLSLTINLLTPGVYYLWQDNSTYSNYNITQAGTYSVLVTDTFKCKAQDGINVSTDVTPKIFIGSDTSICVNELITLTTGAPEQNDYTFMWYNGSHSPTVSIEQEGNYFLIAENICGVTSDSINIVTIDCQCDASVPGAFSPNDDGVNDILYVRGNCIKDISLTVYNRWGQKIFETNDLNKGWDGTVNGVKSNSAVFVYHLSASTTYGHKIIDKKGNISLIK